MILITGASGFIGGALSDYLEKANFKIRRSARNKISQKYFTLNLGNASEIENSCKEVDVVIHLASLDYLQSEKNFSEAKKINFQATKKLYKEAVKNNVSKFIYFSTAHVYGENLKNFVSEVTDPKPLSNYAKTHLMAEQYLYKNAQKSGTNVIILRLSNIVGSPNSNKLKAWKYVANDLCLQAHKNKKIILESQGLQKRDFYSLENLLITIKNIINSKENKLINDVFNLGSGNSISIMNLAKMVKLEYEALFNIEIDIMSGIKQEIKTDLKYDIRKIKSTNSYYSDFSINKSIRKILKYCKSEF